jgi:hypothetical protein
VVTPGESVATAPTEDRLLSEEAQRLVLEFMQRGASPAGACQQIGATIETFWNTIQCSPPFEHALQLVFDSLSQNVAAALYQSAMKGTVAAQTLWLKQRPAPLLTPHETPEDSLAGMTDEQLLDEARAAGLDHAAA